MLDQHIGRGETIEPTHSFSSFDTLPALRRRRETIRSFWKPQSPPETVLVVPIYVAIEIHSIGSGWDWGNIHLFLVETWLPGFSEAT